MIIWLSSHITDVPMAAGSRTEVRPQSHQTSVILVVTAWSRCRIVGRALDAIPGRHARDFAYLIGKAPTSGGGNCG